MADNTAVGWIGLGKMGVPMAGHLLDAGFALTVHNRSAGPEAGLRDASAEIAASPAELAAFVRQMWSSMIANGAGDEDFLAYVKTMETLSGMKAKD